MSVSQKNYQKSVREDIQGYYFKGFNSFRKTVENTKKGVFRETDYAEEANFKFAEYQLSSLTIELKNHATFISESEEEEFVLIGKNTLYIQNISYLEGTYQTIIHRIGQKPVKTREKTADIMTRYFNQQGINYETIQSIGKLLEITKYCPYLLGDICFLPDFGRKQAGTSWLALHHVITGQSHSVTNQTYLFCRNNYRIIIPISYKSFKKRVENATLLYHVQKSAFNLFSQFFESEWLMKKEQPLNIIHQSLLKIQYKLPNYSLPELIEYLKYSWISDSLKKNFGVEDPYLHQVRAFLDIPLRLGRKEKESQRTNYLEEKEEFKM